MSGFTTARNLKYVKHSSTKMHLESHPLSLCSLFAGSGVQTRKQKVAVEGLRTPEVQKNMVSDA